MGIIIPSVNWNYYSLCQWELSLPVSVSSPSQGWSVCLVCPWILLLHHSQPVLEFNSFVTCLSWSWAVLTPRVPGKQSCSFSLAGFWPRSGSLRSCCPRRGAHSKSGEELIQPHKRSCHGRDVLDVNLCFRNNIFLWQNLEMHRVEGLEWGTGWRERLMNITVRRSLCSLAARGTQKLMVVLLHGKISSF